MEQRVHSLSVSSSPIRVFLKRIRLLTVTLFACCLSACIPVGDQTVNTELFKSQDDMRERAAQLKPGMSMKKVFEKISIDQEKFTRMSTQEVQMSIYGNSQVQGTPAQLENFRERLMCYEGYSLPYRDIKAKGSLGFGSFKVNKNGYDLKLVLVFEKGKLMKASVDGDQAVNVNEDQSMFNVAMKRLSGIGF